MGITTHFHVVKIGGSLLSRPSLLDDFYAWTIAQPATNFVVVLGGGEMIEAVRRWDRLRPADPASVHWWCVEMLRYSFSHLTAHVNRDPRFANSATITRPSDWVAPVQRLASLAVEQPFWLWANVESFYHRDQVQPLPHDWTTTTDAIAWSFATKRNAIKCTLLKSCNVDPSKTPRELIDLGIIDAACATLIDNGVPLSVERLPIVSPLASG